MKLIQVAGSNYAVTDLKLFVSRGNQPLAFNAPWLTLKRNQLDSYDSRPLSVRKASAFEPLQVGGNVVWQRTTDQNYVSILAGVRAEKTCTTCHQVSEGTLLGEFAYQLAPCQDRLGE